jgi:hypothetical protein
MVAMGQSPASASRHPGRERSASVSAQRVRYNFVTIVCRPVGGTEQATVKDG